MSDPHVALAMLALLTISIMIGFPIAFALMAIGLSFGYYANFGAAGMQHIFDNRIFDLFVNQTYSVMSSDVLAAIPLFLLMGHVVERANVVDRLFSAIHLAARRMPGSLAIAALLTSALFATATGVVGAVVASMGLLALPLMLKARYDVGLASGAICAGGCLGILVPPSILLIVYAAQANVSVAKLYAAALLPGLLLAGLYLVYVVGRVLSKPSLAPRAMDIDTETYATKEIAWMVMTSALPFALLSLSVLGAILTGLATPPAAAAIGVIGGVLLGAIYGSLSWDTIRRSIYATARTTAKVCWLFVGSATFAAVFAQLGGEAIVKDFVVGLDMTPVQFLILTQIVIFMLGWPLEWPEIIVIVVPIVLPLLKHFGIDPLLFGVLVALNLQSSLLTPPKAMGACLLQEVSPSHVTTRQIVAGCLPFNAIALLCMILIYVLPDIVFWLPSHVDGR